MKRDYFRIAGLLLTLHLPGQLDSRSLLPSFAPFRCNEAGEGEYLLDFYVNHPDAHPDDEAGQLLETNENDMGRVRLYATTGGYRIEIIPLGCRAVHLLQANADFSRVHATLQTEDPGAGSALASLLRIAYSQAILRREAVSIHAAAVYCEGRAYLFLGKSGTGKSTHARLWMANDKACRLLNDDNPTLRIVGNEPIAYGTPWSGKTPCYKNLAFPVGGIVRLRQAPENRFIRREAADAFIELLPGCSVIRQNQEMCNRLYDTLARIAEQVPVGVMECRPDTEAARICRTNLLEKGTGII